MDLYSYFRSSAAYRVRIALNLKGVPYHTIPVHLVKGGGEQFASQFTQLNPNAQVPVLIDGAAPDQALTQSIAIIEYLDETIPDPPLLPRSALERAFVRNLALSIACDIHPLNNLRVLRYLKHELKVGEQERDAWYRHWCERGLAAIEAMLANDKRVGRFCCGDVPGLADCCLVPQVANARRYQCDLTAMPTVLRINDACLSLDAFKRAAPEAQPDAE